MSMNVQEYWFCPYVLDTHRQDNWSQLSKGILHTIITYHITLDILCLAYKAGERSRNERGIGSDDVCLPKLPFSPMGPALQEKVEQAPASP